MNKKILVSIVMTVYNHKNYIEQALNSVLMQNVNFMYEVWLGEDASPDGTASVLKELEPSLPENFHIIYRSVNFGGEKNLFDLISRTSGKYIIILEGDDYWIDINKLQIQVDYLESHKNCICCAHNIVIVNEKGKELDILKYPECKKEKYTLEDYTYEIMPGQTASLLYKNIFKDPEFPLLTNVFPFPYDQVIAFMLASHGDVYCIQKKMSAYRYCISQGTSWSAQRKRKTLKENYLSDLKGRKQIYEYSLKSIGTYESIKAATIMYYATLFRGIRKNYLNKREAFKIVISFFKQKGYRRDILKYRLKMIIQNGKK